MVYVGYYWFGISLALLPNKLVFMAIMSIKKIENIYFHNLEKYIW